MAVVEHKTREALGQEVSRAEFLHLSASEAALVSMRLALVPLLAVTRQRSGLTQTALAALIGSSQSRIAKAERGDVSVSLELLVKAVIASGGTLQQISEAIGRF